MSIVKVVLIISALLLLANASYAESTSIGVTNTASTLPLPSISSGNGGGSSGGSGGGIISSESFNNVQQFETHDNNLLANQLISYKFNLPVYEVLLIGKENEYDVSVRVEMLKDKPNKATIKPDGEVIQYFNVITSTKRLKEALIRFKSNEPVELWKWNGNQWELIYSVDDTETLNKLSKPADDKYLYYTYQLPTLSNFAIVRIVTKTSSTIEVITPASSAIPAQTASNIEITPISQKTPSIPGFEFIGVILMLFGIYKLRKGK